LDTSASSRGTRPLFHKFHDAHLGADAVVEIAEFDADGARAYHDHAFGLVSRLMALRYSMIFLPSIGRLGSSLARPPVAMMMCLAVYSVTFAFCVGDGDFGAFDEFGAAHDDRDFVLFHQELHALAHAFGHAPLRLIMASKSAGLCQP
jgi:hypothetical protein